MKLSDLKLGDWVRFCWKEDGEIRKSPVVGPIIRKWDEDEWPYNEFFVVSYGSGHVEFTNPNFADEVKKIDSEICVIFKGYGHIFCDSPTGSYMIVDPDRYLTEQGKL